MINIHSIKGIVLDKENRKFGFHFSFQSGLNILSGDNSSGKSTVLACIYYCLGMEQLASYGNTDGLKECLKSSFKYNDESILVNESYAELNLSNDRGGTATIKRSIKSNYGEDPNVLIVQTNDGVPEDKFIHAKGDSDHDSGFYRWLSDFSGIAIPVFKSDNGVQKILYLQQIFASSFVEQTKGWSDFFAQVPIFNTKKAKQKIVEYTLGLSGLVEEFELDKLKEEEKAEKGNWGNSVDNFQSLVAFNNFTTPNLSTTFTTELKPKKIEALTLQTRGLDGQYLSIDDSITNLNSLLRSLKQKNEISVDHRQKNNNLLKRQAEFRQKLKFLTEEHTSIQKEKINEEIKIQRYQSTLEQLKREIEVLEGLNKLNQLQSFHIGAVENCPVCNSSLLANPDVVLQNVDRINALGSLPFYKSERSLYESYIKSSKNLLERFEKTLLYYKEQINDLQFALVTIDKEIVDDSRIPSRTDINDEIQIRFELGKVEKIKIQFERFKLHLTELSNNLIRIKERRDILQSHKKDDEEQIFSFQKVFIQYLESFGYSKEIIGRIYISNEDNNKLFPVVKTPGFL